MIYSRVGIFIPISTQSVTLTQTCTAACSSFRQCHPECIFYSLRLYNVKFVTYTFPCIQLRMKVIPIIVILVLSFSAPAGMYIVSN